MPAPNVIHLKATGVTATDTANLQDALSSLQYVVYPTSSTMPVLKLSGSFSIDTTITANADDRKTPSIDGQGRTNVHWAGAAQDGYMFDLGSPSTSSGKAFSPIFSNIALNCNYTTRGVKVHQGGYRPCIENVMIHWSRGIGVDLVDCWGGSTRGLEFYQVRGMAIRSFRCMQHRFSNITISANAVLPAAGSEVTTTEMWTYEVDNGRAAAKLEYGADYVEYYPAADDASVVGYLGAADYVRTLANARALFVQSGSMSSIRDIVIQGSRSLSDPLILMSGTCTLLDNVYLETNICRFGLIVVVSGIQGSSGVAEGRGSTVSHVRMHSVHPLGGDRTSRSVVELRGRTFDARLNSCMMKNVRHFIYASHGAHYGAAIERCGSSAGEITAENEIVAADGVTLDVASKTDAAWSGDAYVIE